MDLKLIKVNADIVSAIIAQWNHTGTLGDLERRLLVGKVTELYESIIAADAEAGTHSGVSGDKKDAEVSLTEFSVEMGDAPEAESPTGGNRVEESQHMESPAPEGGSEPAAAVSHASAKYDNDSAGDPGTEFPDAAPREGEPATGQGAQFMMPEIENVAVVGGESGLQEARDIGVTDGTGVPDAKDSADVSGESGLQETQNYAVPDGTGVPEAENSSAPGGESGLQETQNYAVPDGIGVPEAENSAVAGEGREAEEAETPDDYPEGVRRGRTDRSVIRSLYEDDVVEVRVTVAEIDAAPREKEGEDAACREAAAEKAETVAEDVRKTGAEEAGTIPEERPAAASTTRPSGQKAVFGDVVGQIAHTLDVRKTGAEEAGTIPEERSAAASATRPSGQKAVIGDVVGQIAHTLDVRKTGAEEAGTIPEERPAAASTTRPSGQKAVIGDVVGQSAHTLGETISHPANDVASRINSGRIDSIRRHIGINDKYLMISELFGGDAEACAATLEILEGFGSIEDAMLWIHDNHDWEADCRSAQLLTNLLIRKLI